MRPPSARLRAPALVALAAAASVLCLAGAAGAAEGWPMAGHDPAHTGTVDGPAPPYEVAWSSEVAAGGPISGAAATDDVVVVASRDGIVALDPADGTELWERGRFRGPAGIPAVAGDLVLHSSGQGGTGQLVARDIATGSVVWQTPLGGAAPGGPTIANGSVFVGTTGAEVVALDLRTGEERWRFHTVGDVTGAPSFADGLVVAAAYQASTSTSTVYGIDAETGQSDWQLSPGVVGSASATAIGGGRAYVGTSDLNIDGLELGEGTEVWTSRSRDGFGPRQVPAAGESLILADRSHVYRLDPATGEETWNYLLADLTATAGGRFNTLLASAPAVTGRSVLIGSGDGTLSAIDIDSGHRVWRRDLGERAVGPVAATTERIYAVTLGEGGSVVALEHDPDGRLIDEISPSVLFLSRALLNFVAAALALALVLVLVFRFALRPRAGERA